MNSKFIRNKDSEYVVRLFFEFTDFIANMLWIYLIFREFTIYSLSLSRSISRFHNKFVESQIHYEFKFCSANSLYITLINHEIIIVLTTQLFIDFLFQEFTIYFANILWAHYLLRKSTIFLPNQHVYIIFLENSQKISRIHYEFTVCFGNSPCIDYRFRE